jgi:CelD/BcsL family acetyltransferase involved in cellulose biosynthesis
MNDVHNRFLERSWCALRISSSVGYYCAKVVRTAPFDSFTLALFTVFLSARCRLMAEIAILPLSEDPQFSALFVQPAWAEGSFGWFQALAETTLDPGEEAVVVVVFDDGAARAALPLVRKGTQMRALAAPYTTIYAPALSDPRWARFLGAEAQRYVSGSLRLDALDPADAGVAAYLDGMESSGLIAAQYRHFVNRYEPIGDFENYWNARPSRLKATVRRKLAQASAQQADFRCQREGFGEAVGIYEDIYRASWKPAEPHPRFIANMVEKLARDGFVRLGILTLAGKPVAAQIWLVCGRKGTIFKLAHRQDAAYYSPGTLLTHWMVATLVREDGLDEVDFGRGDDAYKRDWLDHERLRTGLVAGTCKSAAGLRVIAGEVLPTRLSAAARKAISALTDVLAARLSVENRAADCTIPADEI